MGHRNEPITRRQPQACGTTEKGSIPMAFRQDQDDRDNDDLEGATALAERKRRSKGKQPPITKTFFEDDEYSQEELDAMMAMYDETLSSIEEGEIVKAKVIRVTENAVIL